MRTLSLSLALGFAMSAACSEPNGDLALADPMLLTWVAPDSLEDIAVGDAVELTVSTQRPDARAMRFLVDGQEVGTCDPSQLDADCKTGDFWQWTTNFDVPGHHTLTAVLDTTSGEPITATRDLDVLETPPAEPADEEGSATEEDPVDLDQLVIDGTDTIVDADANGRGSLDPSHDFHNPFGGLEWAVRGQRVVLRRGHIDGQMHFVGQCMADFGSALARYADPSHVSRAAVVAAGYASSMCNTSSQHIFGISGARCAAVMHAKHSSISPSDCRARMSSFDFATSVAVDWIRQKRRIHHRDPPLMAAAFALGAVRRSTNGNAWLIAAPRVHNYYNHQPEFISSFVAGYNAYRSLDRLVDVFKPLPVIESVRCSDGARASINVPHAGPALYEFDVPTGLNVRLRSAGPGDQQPNVHYFFFDDSISMSGFGSAQRGPVDAGWANSAQGSLLRLYVVVWPSGPAQDVQLNATCVR